MTKFGVVGSRQFNDYNMLKSVLDELINDGDAIVSGGAQGTDSLAKQYAEERGLEYIEFRPDWKKYGRSAGMIRNGEIVNESDFVIAFWDGQSKGTKNSINRAKKQNKLKLIKMVADETLGG